MSKPHRKKRPPKQILVLPDLEQSKAAVLNSLTSKSGQRTYDRAIDDFVEWYCLEPRLALNRAVVLRYRIFLEQKQYAPTCSSATKTSRFSRTKKRSNKSSKTSPSTKRFASCPSRWLSIKDTPAKSAVTP